MNTRRQQIFYVVSLGGGLLVTTARCGNISDARDVLWLQRDAKKREAQKLQEMAHQQSDALRALLKKQEVDKEKEEAEEVTARFHFYISKSSNVVKQSNARLFVVGLLYDCDFFVCCVSVCTICCWWLVSR
jgi:shikimate kinase